MLIGDPLWKHIVPGYSSNPRSNLPKRLEGQCVEVLILVYHVEPIESLTEI